MKKILVVDDQPDNVFILQDRLKRAGFEVIAAYEGATGIQKTIDEKPDLILLDIMMPDISGFDVCRRLVANEETKNIPIILVTALTDAEDIKEGFDAGAFDYIKKPFNRDEMLARINSALRFNETNNLLLELEKVKTFNATVITANHEIKQPLTLINLSTAAIRRELNKNEQATDFLLKRVEFIEKATHDIIDILEKLSSIKKPIFIDYLNNLKMINLQPEDEKESVN